MSLVGPINSGAAIGGDGVATANATTATPIIGEIKVIYVRYNDSPPATTDITIATAGTDAPANTILTLTDANTSNWFYTRHATSDETGTVITYDGTREVHVCPVIHDLVKVTIAQANAGDSVDVWLLVD